MSCSTDDVLSCRAQRLLSMHSPEASIQKVYQANKYDPIENATGIISLAWADNLLCTQLLHERVCIFSFILSLSID